jgi:hypothetical protein
MEPSVKFYILDLSPKWGKPKKDKIQLLPLCKNIQAITATEYKDMMDLL